jgi:uncharacterized protein
MKYIAGIDPGLVSGIAIIDVNSKNYKLYSEKNFSFSSICSFLIENGDPIIIATDVASIPNSVKKIASSFGARLYKPAEDISVLRKKNLTKNTGYKNLHERDALAAALTAKKEFVSLFEKIDYSLEKRKLSHMRYEIKELLVKGEAGNIEHAIRMLSVSPKKDTKIITKIMETRKIAELRKKIDMLLKSRHILRSKIEKMKMLERSNAPHIKPEIFYDSITRENENLRKEIKSMEELVQNFEKYELIALPGDIVEDRIVFADKSTDIKLLESKNPKAIISNEKIDSFIPVINAGKVKRAGKFLFIAKEEIGKFDTGNNFLKWLQKYREERHAKA